jgi:hypothetical protein
MPLPRVLSNNEEYDATGVPTEEEDVEDFDNIDDADEALQGLSLNNDNEVLARIPLDSDVSDWDWEAEGETFPTIDESQVEDDFDALMATPTLIPPHPPSSSTTPQVIPPQPPSSSTTPQVIPP